jgi:RIO-like serine/threonine protein kinase
VTEILRRLALHGLVHCDFNEFNLMVDQEGQVTLIDFPQVRERQLARIGQEGRVGRVIVDRTL